MIKTQLSSVIIFCISFFFFCNALSAQNLGIYVSPGLINYGGDLQGNLYTFSQSNFSFGAGLMYSFNKLVFRGSIMLGKIQGSDSASSDYAVRNLSFQSKITEVNLGLEYDLFSLDEKKITPYGFISMAVYHFDPYTYYNSEKVYLNPLSTEGQGLPEYPDRKPYSLTQFTVPLGIGVKYKLSENFFVAAEFCSRILFTDYLDDVSAKYPDEAVLLKEKGQLAVDVSFRADEKDPTQPFPSGRIRGNAGRNDSYYTSSLNLIYMFPKRAEFNNGDNYYKKSRRVNCPKL